jgi:hypothetical protein
MSVWTTRVINCPRCDAPAELQLADSIHVSRVPEVRAAVLDRTFHRTTCHRCTTPIEVQRRVLYIDVERGQWIVVVPTSDAEHWPEREAALQRGLTRALEHGSPLIAPLADGVRCRLVVGYEQLREKLVLWAAGLNDAVVECLKLRLIAAEPDLATARTALVVDAVTTNDELVMHLQRGSDVRSFIVPSELVRRTDEQQNTLALRYPELFRGAFVNIDRLLGDRYRNPEVSC